MQIAIITNVIPIYRKVFYEKLFSCNKFDVKIYCSNSLKGMNLKLCHNNFPDHVRILKSWSFSKELFAWQSLPIKELLEENDLFIFYGNPRVVSNVVWSSLFILMGKSVAIWGQAHTANSNKVLERIRLLWWSIFDNIFVYTDEEVAYLRSRGFNARKNIVGMNNGLDQEAIDNVQNKWDEDKLKIWLDQNKLSSKCILLSCARLVKKNNFDQIIKALPILKLSHPDILWCVIGDGPEKNNLLSEAEKYHVEENILWLGSMYDENDLAPWFMCSKLMIHPGAIGLSLMHSFGYGLPVVTHDERDSHMPEYAAFRKGENGMVFIKDDIQDLVKVICNSLQDSKLLEQMKHNALTTARTQYNVKVMVTRFIMLMDSMKQESNE